MKRAEERREASVVVFMVKARLKQLFTGNGLREDEVEMKRVDGC